MFTLIHKNPINGFIFAQLHGNLRKRNKSFSLNDDVHIETVHSSWDDILIFITRELDRFIKTNCIRNVLFSEEPSR